MTREEAEKAIETNEWITYCDEFRAKVESIRMIGDMLCLAALVEVGESKTIYVRSPAEYFDLKKGKQ